MKSINVLLFSSLIASLNGEVQSDPHKFKTGFYFQ